MSLPRFELDDEAAPSDAAITARLSAAELDDVEIDGAELDALYDATQPAQFLLTLPDTFVRRLNASPRRPFEPPAPPPRAAAAFALPLPVSFRPVSMATPSAAWTMEAPRSSLPTLMASAPKTANLLVVAASVIVGCVFVIVGIVGTGSSAEPAAHGPVGIAVRAPKTLEKTIRTRDRVSGYSSKVAAVTVSIESLHHVRSRHRY